MLYSVGANRGQLLYICVYIYIWGGVHDLFRTDPKQEICAILDHL